MKKTSARQKKRLADKKNVWQTKKTSGRRKKRLDDIEKTPFTPKTYEKSRFGTQKLTRHVKKMSDEKNVWETKKKKWTRQKSGRRLLSDIWGAAHTPTPLLLAAGPLSPPTQSCRIHNIILGGRLKHHAGHNEIFKRNAVPRRAFSYAADHGDTDRQVFWQAWPCWAERNWQVQPNVLQSNF